MDFAAGQDQKLVVRPTGIESLFGKKDHGKRNKIAG
jgi:hypothetical protein